MSVLKPARRGTRALRTAVLTCAAAGAALSLTACDDGSATGAAAADTPSAAASATAGGGDGGGTKDTQGGAGAGAADDQQAAPRGGAGDRCRTADLNIFFGGRSADGGAHQQTVAVSNKSHRTCTLQGFPGVDLKDAHHTWSLVRSSAKTPKVTLAPQDVSLFTIAYAPFEKGGENVAFTPTSAVITPPGDTTPVTLRWEAGSLLLQDGATHPATFVNPVVPRVSASDS